MPDGNRFAGLSDALGGEEGDAELGEREGAEQSPDGAVDGDAVDDQTTDDETVDEASSESAPEEGGPAFSFEETTPKSVYVRDETLDALEDLEFEVEVALRREYGVRDVTGREFHDALVRVAAEHADDIAALVVETRDS